jgi:hypothetical protein
MAFVLVSVYDELSELELYDVCNGRQNKFEKSVLSAQILRVKNLICYVLQVLYGPPYEIHSTIK